MKSVIFNFLSDLGESIIVGTQVLMSFLLDVQTRIANDFIETVATTFKMILWMVDQDRINHAQHVMEQMSMTNELDILMNVTKLKEDALERRTWTQHHSIALNELSSKLYHECDWDKARIHDYMRTLVESIPGLSYVAGDDDDDDDDDSISLDD
jgi:hypothetical protein